MSGLNSGVARTAAPERWAVGSGGYNVNMIYNQDGNGVLQVFGLPSNSKVDDPDLNGPPWSEGMRVARLAASAPAMADALSSLIEAAQDVADEVRRNACNIGMGGFIDAIRQARSALA